MLFCSASIVYQYCKAEHFLLFPNTCGGGRFENWVVFGEATAKKAIEAAAARAKAAESGETTALVDPFFESPVFRTTDSTAISSAAQWAPLPRHLAYPTAEEDCPTYAATRYYILAVSHTRIDTKTKLIELAKLGSTVGVNKRPYTWEGVDPCNLHRAGGGFTLCNTGLSGEDVYCFGGLVDQNADAKPEIVSLLRGMTTRYSKPFRPILTDRVECFEGATKTWKEMPPLPKPRPAGLQACYSSLDGKIYLYGSDDLFQSFDTATRKYETLASPYPEDAQPFGAWTERTHRSGAGMVYWRGQILLIAGIVITFDRGSPHPVNRPTRSVLSYSIRENKWTEWRGKNRATHLSGDPGNGQFLVTSDDKIWAFWRPDPRLYLWLHTDNTYNRGDCIGRHDPARALDHPTKAGSTVGSRAQYVEYYNPHTDEWQRPPPEATDSLCAIPPLSITNRPFQMLCVST